MKKALYSGKAKTLYATNDDTQVLIHYNDDATAGNGQKHAVIAEKGIYNNCISSLIYKVLEENGIPTHYIETLNEREQLCQLVDIIPLEVIVRNVIAGSAAKRLGLEEGRALNTPIFEICYKNDDLGDPLINDDHAVALGIASYDELDEIYSLVEQINDVLYELFSDCGIQLVDFKVEFGRSRTEDGAIILADEISPDTCRLWDIESGAHLDKDVFRRDLGELIPAYNEVLARLEKVLGEDADES